MTHTPAPWSCERIWNIPETRIHADVEGRRIALAEAFTMPRAGEKEANAHLIAAAPDMLVMLRRVLGSQWTADDVSALISKAEGRS